MRDYNSIQFNPKYPNANQQQKKKLQPPPTYSSKSNNNNKNNNNNNNNTSNINKSRSAVVETDDDDGVTPEKITTSSTSTANSTVTSTPVPRYPSPFRSGSPVPIMPPAAAASTTSNASPQQRDASSTSAALSPTDALNLRREGPEATIFKLRAALEEAKNTAENRHAAIAKSDAVILELRSTVRQLKRQLEVVQNNRGVSSASSVMTDENTHANQSASRDAVIGELQVQLDRAHAQILTADMVRKELEDTLEAEQYTWELRVQDQERTIAELQALADRLSQDLEVCRSQWKEAEVQWAKQLEELRAELQKARSNAAAATATSTSRGMPNAGGDELGEWKEKVVALQQERAELQSCLDEALKELEAVDAELQNDVTAEIREENERLKKQVATLQANPNNSSNILEPLQHLLRWLLEKNVKEEEAGPNAENNSSEWKQYTTASELVQAIQVQIERFPSSSGANETEKQRQLENQISAYRGDLKAHEESNAELRASLKEAVALLRPLQEAVAKADREKAKLTEQLERAKTNADESLSEIKSYKSRLNDKEDEIERLKEQIESLELQLSKAKLAAASPMLSMQNNSNNVNRSMMSNASDVSNATSSETSLNRAREELRAKRQSEQALQQLLRDTQTKFQSLHQQNQQVEAMNNALQGRLRQAEESSLEAQPSSAAIADLEEKAALVEKLQTTILDHQARIRELESETLVLRGELAKKDVELRNAQNELHEAKSSVRELRQIEADGGNSSEKLQRLENRIRELEESIAEKSRIIATKREAERALNRSLKDALGVIKPLQMHLEDAEEEKKELARELDALKRKMMDGASAMMNGSRSIGLSPSNDAHIETMRGLENLVHELEKENSQLQDALEEMSQSLNASHMNGTNGKGESRLREEIVELKSRYEVTQGRLDDAFVENHTLIEVLRKREKEEDEMMKEMTVLKERLRASEAELEKAKSVATSALVAVEEMSLSNAEQRLDRQALFEKKARELDYEIKLARDHESSVPYR
jgi:chromosome segregation ATPase